MKCQRTSLWNSLIKIYFAIIAFGCNKEELEDFNGVKNCKGFVAGRDTTEFYKKLKEGKKNGMQT